MLVHEVYSVFSSDENYFEIFYQINQKHVLNVKFVI